MRDPDQNSESVCVRIGLLSIAMRLNELNAAFFATTKGELMKSSNTGVPKLFDQ